MPRVGHLWCLELVSCPQLGTWCINLYFFLALSWVPLMPLELPSFAVGHLRCFHFHFGTSSWAPVLPPVGHRWCLELGISHASSWAPLMPRVGDLWCLELGTSHAWTLKPRAGHPPLMPRVGHLSCLELVTYHVLSWARLMPRVGHLSCLELGI